MNNIQHSIAEVVLFKQVDCSRLGLLGNRTQDRDLHVVNLLGNSSLGMEIHRGEGKRQD